MQRKKRATMIFFPLSNFSVDGRVYEHSAPSYFEVDAKSPGSRKGISMAIPRSGRELALQIGTKLLRFEIPEKVKFSETEPVVIHDIPCVLPEGHSIVCMAEITGYPLSVRLSSATDGFDWFWLNVTTSVDAMNQGAIGPVTRSMSSSRRAFVTFDNSLSSSHGAFDKSLPVIQGDYD